MTRIVLSAILILLALSPLGLLAAILAIMDRASRMDFRLSSGWNRWPLGRWG